MDDILSEIEEMLADDAREKKQAGRGAKHRRRSGVNKGRRLMDQLLGDKATRKAGPVTRYFLPPLG